MTSFDLDFEIITDLQETTLINSINEILNIKNIKLNNPLINDYIFKIFNNKLEYNELFLSNFEKEYQHSISPKRPNTPIHNLDTKKMILIII